MNRRLYPLALAAAASLLALPLAGADYRASASVTLAENLSRTSAASTQKDATLYAGSVTVAERRQFAAGWTLGVEAEAGLEQVPDFPALDRFQAGASASLRRKFGLGPLAPVLHLHAGVRREQFDETHRRGWAMTGGATATKRLTEAWQASLGGEVREFAANLHPFDVRQRRLFLETSWDFNERWRLAGGLARQWGEITANAAWPVYGTALAGGFGPAIQSYYSSIPWAVTDTFGPGWVAYRVDARTDSWWLGLSPALSDRTSLALRYEFVKVINRVRVRYDSEFWSLSLAHRF